MANAGEDWSNAGKKTDSTNGRKREQKVHVKHNTTLLNVKQTHAIYFIGNPFK